MSENHSQTTALDIISRRNGIERGEMFGKQIAVKDIKRDTREIAAARQRHETQRSPWPPRPAQISQSPLHRNSFGDNAPRRRPSRYLKHQQALNDDSDNLAYAWRGVDGERKPVCRLTDDSRIEAEIAVAHDLKRRLRMGSHAGP